MTNRLQVKYTGHLSRLQDRSLSDPTVITITAQQKAEIRQFLVFQLSDLYKP